MVPQYDQSFFQYMDRAAVASATAVVPELVRLVGPGSVLDVGCGRGAWLAAFEANGVSDLLGLDGPWLAPEDTIWGGRHFRNIDLQDPPALGRRYDLVLCVEVAEHLEAAVADRFVEFLCGAGEVVCFSAAVPGQGGTGHVNEQWPDYWQAKFRRHGYELCDVLRDAFWDHPDVAWCYSQNAFLFAPAARRADLLAARRPVDPPLRRVHPRLLQNTLERPTAEDLGVSEIIRTLVRKVPQAVKRRIRA